MDTAGMLNGGSGGGGGGGSGDGRAAKTPMGRRPVEVMLGDLFDRTPPHSPEAERALLGAMILDPNLIADVIRVVTSSTMFYEASNAAIFDTLVQMYDTHQAGDLALLATLLRDKHELEPVGGEAYLRRIVEETPGPSTAPHFAGIVRDKSRLRRLILAGGEIVYEAYQSTANTGEATREVVDRAESKIFEIAQEEESSAAEPLSALVLREYDRLDSLHGKGISGIQTGYDDLDKDMSGLQDGEMIIVAARPSMGKTALALNLAEQVALGGASSSAEASRKCPVGVFSLEMSKSAIALRMLSAKSGISSHDMRSGRLKDDDYKQLFEACGELHNAPIYIDDTPALTILGLRTRARRMVAQHGVRAIFIDYLQLMSSPSHSRESRQVEVSAISRGVKALARELSIPVVCLSQLNRGPEGRTDNRPRMSDLRESGAIEQDADVVILLHREEYYHIGDEDWLNDPANEDKIGVAELIIAKQRNGPTGSVRLVWDQSTTRFKNQDRMHRYDNNDYAGAMGRGIDPAEYKMPVVPFSPGSKTGPVADFRDGGGPDQDDGSGIEEPPF